MSRKLTGAHVVVVGAGVMGTCVALRLAESGARVTLVDETYPAGGTSKAAFGWINAFDKGPRAVFDLHVRAMDEYQRLLSETGGDWATFHGSIHWADRDDATRVADLRGAVAELRGWDVTVDELSVDGLRAIEPDLRLDTERVDSVFVVRQGGHAYVVPLVNALLDRAANRHDSRYLRGRVARLIAGDRPAVLLEDGVRIDADRVVLAAGSGAQALARGVGLDIPIESVPGNQTVTAPAPVSLDRVVLAPGVSLRPDGGGRLMIGTDQLTQSEQVRHLAIDDPLVTEALRRARAIVPALADIPVEGTRSGVRAIPQGGLPVVGESAQAPGIYFAVTHNAVTLAPALASLIADDLGGQAADLEGFRPDRFANRDTAGPLASTAR
ncbi:MAG: FAD-binding oxidoreductase [Microbacterium sp.]|uniref:NAD(P)/FAD-dependent oxidoreductase n=1 Tax=Microbacterium sp. TaxID=51671 RepID=UPI0039E5614E